MFKMLHALLIVYYLSFFFNGQILQAAGATPTKVFRTPIEPQSPLSPGRVLYELGQIQPTPARTNPKDYAKEQIDTAGSRSAATAARYRRHKRKHMSSQELSSAPKTDLEEGLSRYLTQLQQLETNRSRGNGDENDAITAFGLTSNNIGDTTTYYETINGKVIGTRPDAIGAGVMLEIKSKRGKKPTLYQTQQLRAQEEACKRQGFIHKIVITTKETNPRKFPHISRSFKKSRSNIRLVTKDGSVYRRCLDQWIKVKA